MKYRKTAVKKIVIITSGFFFLLTSVYSQRMEFNDPQIISIVETVSRIDMDYSKRALDKSQSKTISSFADTMIESHTDVLSQTLALKEELILSIQTNVFSRSFTKRHAANINLLAQRNPDYIDITYVDNQVAFYKEAHSILQKVLIPQARNEKLKEFLITISPVWEQNLKDAVKTQAEVNK